MCTHTTILCWAVGFYFHHTFKALSFSNVEYRTLQFQRALIFHDMVLVKKKKGTHFKTPRVVTLIVKGMSGIHTQDRFLPDYIHLFLMQKNVTEAFSCLVMHYNYARHVLLNNFSNSMISYLFHNVA